jgi:hypothetical protein
MLNARFQMNSGKHRFPERAENRAYNNENTVTVTVGIPASSKKMLPCEPAHYFKSRHFFCWRCGRCRRVVFGFCSLKVVRSVPVSVPAPQEPN